MSNYLPRLCTAIILLLLGIYPVFPSKPVQAGDERIVLAFYYAWFDWSTWSKPLSDQPVEQYLSADVSVIERHVLEAKRAGIDALVQAWYGPQVKNNQTEPNFRLLLDQSQAYGMKAAVSVDLGSEHFLQDGEAVVAGLTMLRDQHALHPAYLRVAGRPVVFFWNQRKFSVASWEAVRNQVDPENTMLWIAEGDQLAYLDVFDGLYLYNIAWANEPASVLVRWGELVRTWRLEHDAFRYWVATVMPGYDDRVTGRADAFVRSRGSGSFYRECWGGAQQSQADWVVITSFNEWLEGTQIEPSVSYGDTYIDLTASLASDYRSYSYVSTSTPEPSTLTPEPETPTATLELQSPTPTAEPETPTVTPVLTPTATLRPSATPFRLATPTPTPTPTFPPTLDLPPAPTSPRLSATPTPVLNQQRPATVVEGEPRAKLCSILPALLPFVILFVVRSLWRVYR